VTISPEPTLITDSGSFLTDSLNSAMSGRVHMFAAAIGGTSPKQKHNHHRAVNICFNSSKYSIMVQIQFYAFNQHF
jgi:hypothetical protein